MPHDGIQRKALTVVPEKVRRITEGVLRPGENVHVAFVGSGGQAMIATDDRMLVVKAGFMAGATFGSKTLDIPFSQISSIELRVGLLTGYLQIMSSSYQGNLPGSFWTSDAKHDPWKLPNCIPVARGAAKLFQPHLALVRERIATGYWSDGIGPDRRPTPQATDNGQSKSGDLAAQLKELATLRDVGALSDDEFARAKQKLLG